MSHRGAEAEWSQELPASEAERRLAESRVRGERNPPLPPLDTRDIAPFKLFRVYKELHVGVPEVVYNDEEDLKTSGERMAWSHTTDLLLETDADFARKADYIASQVALLARASHQSRRRLADAILQRQRGFLPALPALFVDAVDTGSRWHRELVALQALHEPLRSEHDVLKLEAERLQKRLDNSKAELGQVNKEKREAVEMSVGFERQKMAMLHKKMDADLDAAVELRGLYGGDMELYKNELEDAMVKLHEREEDIAELTERCGELTQVKQDLNVNEQTVVRLEGELMQIEDKQEKSERERKALEAGMAQMEEANASMREELELLRGEKAEWEAAKPAEAKEKEKGGPKGGEKKGSKEKHVRRGSLGKKGKRGKAGQPKDLQEALDQLEADLTGEEGAEEPGPGETLISLRAAGNDDCN